MKPAMVITFIAFASCSTPREAAPPNSVEPERQASPLRLSVNQGRRMILGNRPEIQELPVTELTTPDLWERLHAQLFRIVGGTDKYRGHTFLIHDERAFELGVPRGYGGPGVVSYCVTDLDPGGDPEMFFSYGWGSGLHRTQVGVVFFESEGPRQVKARVAYLGDAYYSELFVRRTDDREVVVEEGQWAGINRWSHARVVGRLALASKDGRRSVEFHLEPDLPEEILKRFRLPEAK